MKFGERFLHGCEKATMSGMSSTTWLDITVLLRRGGGLIRSIGVWDEVKKMRANEQDRIKSDQRILGESGFV